MPELVYELLVGVAAGLITVMVVWLFGQLRRFFQKR